MGVVSQKAEADTESPTPIQIDEPNPVIRVGERSMLQDSCQSPSHVDNNNEDTSPLRTWHWAQKQEERAEQVAAQEAKKNQRGKGRIKNIAREKGLAQRKEKQALGPNSGTKRQINLLLSEKELENLDNSAKKRKGGSIVCIDHGVYHNENASVHYVSDIAYNANNSDTNEAQNDITLNMHCVKLGTNDESDILAVAAVQHRRKP